MADHIVRKILSMILVAGIACLAGCGGGGGGGTAGGSPTGGGLATPTTPTTPAPTTLGLQADAPSLTGKTGQEVTVPVTVTGSGTVTTATLDISFNDGVFEPTGTRGDTGGQSAQTADLPAGTVARYKWTDSHTIRVVYASADGASAGSVFLNVPVKVKAESAAGVTVANVTLNQ
ncbi:MAG: cohesin domain-containing protein [Armatimonadetes bacterium]|nr:cohesin domain-containing protein [Armatimonadota bacterium]